MNIVKEQRVTLSGDIAERYVVRDQRDGGELLIAPDTSVEAIRERGGSRALTDEEWQAFLDEYGPPMLPPDGEG